MRPRHIVALGGVLGILGALAAYASEQTSLAGGANAAGGGFGTSHLLFFLGLPWSVGVVLLMWMVGATTGGYRWPSGDCRAAATFSLTTEAIGTVLEFESGVDDLDYYRAAGVELPSGRRVNLIWYERAPILSLLLEVDSADDLAAAREEVMTVLGIERHEVSWIPDADVAVS